MSFPRSNHRTVGRRRPPACATPRRWRGAVVAGAAASGLLVQLGAPALASASTTHTNPTVKPAASAPRSAAVNISESGSTLLYPLFQLWSTAYHNRDHSVTITPEGTGSGTGISEAAAGTVDIGASDAYLSKSDVAEHPGLENIALAISAQQVNYNVKGIPASTHLKLDGQVLSAIYRGVITEWNAPQLRALNPGIKLPAERIVALHRTDSSGDTFLFSSYLSDQDPSVWGKKIGFGTSIAFPAIPNALGEEGNGGMVTGCEATPGCVAYIGISYLGKTQAGHLGQALVKNRAGRFLPPVASTIVAEAAALEKTTPPSETLSMIDDSAPDGYPIINYEYGILPAHESSPAVAQAVKTFLDWAVSRSGGSSTSFLSKVNFQPLPPAVTVLSERQIAQIGG